MPKAKKKPAKKKAAKRKPAKKRAKVARPAPPVLVPAPDYVTTCSIPYEVRVADLAETSYGTTTELANLKVIRYRQDFASPIDLFLTIGHEALEAAIMENLISMEDHKELDRAAHVVAEHFLAWVMAQ